MDRQWLPQVENKVFDAGLRGRRGSEYEGGHEFLFLFVGQMDNLQRKKI